MGRSLTIVGASARAAAFSAARAGFEPYAIDHFADRDLAELCPAVRVERYPLLGWPQFGRCWVTVPRRSAPYETRAA
jgi:hypothetical protein